MTEPYTPTTEDVREAWRDVWANPPEHENAGAEFDRWLAAELAAAERVGAERALQLAGEAINDLPYIRDWDGYTVDDAAYAMQSDVIEVLRALLLVSTETEGQ